MLTFSCVIFRSCTRIFVKFWVEKNVNICNDLNFSDVYWIIKCIWSHANIMQIFWQKFYRNVPGVVLYEPYEFCTKSLILIGCHGNRKVKFSKKYSKIFFSEVIKGINLKLYINVCVIILYITYVFYCCCACGFVAMATLIFHWFIMGKVKVGLFYLTLGILTIALQ